MYESNGERYFINSVGAAEKDRRKSRSRHWPRQVRRAGPERELATAGVISRTG